MFIEQVLFLILSTGSIVLLALNRILAGCVLGAGASIGLLVIALDFNLWAVATYGALQAAIFFLGALSRAVRELRKSKPADRDEHEGGHI